MMIHEKSLQKEETLSAPYLANRTIITDNRPYSAPRRLYKTRPPFVSGYGFVKALSKAGFVQARRPYLAPTAGPELSLARSSPGQPHVIDYGQLIHGQLIQTFAVVRKKSRGNVPKGTRMNLYILKTDSPIQPVEYEKLSFVVERKWPNTFLGDPVFNESREVLIKEEAFWSIASEADSQQSQVFIITTAKEAAELARISVLCPLEFDLIPINESDEVINQYHQAVTSSPTVVNSSNFGSSASFFSALASILFVSFAVGWLLSRVVSLFLTKQKKH